MTAFNNRSYKLNPSFHEGIISVQIYAEGVDTNDDDIMTKMIKTKEDISAYLGNGNSIKLA